MVKGSPNIYCPDLRVMANVFYFLSLERGGGHVSFEE